MSKSMIDPKARSWRFWKKKDEPVEQDEDFFRASQWQLVWWKFRHHKLANIGVIVLAVFYITTIFAGYVKNALMYVRARQFHLMIVKKLMASYAGRSILKPAIHYGVKSVQIADDV